MSIILFPRHKIITCGIDGSLSMCETCGGAEGAMPTDCPQAPCSYETLTAVYDGTLDYDRRLGWVKRSRWDVIRARAGLPPYRDGAS